MGKVSLVTLLLLSTGCSNKDVSHKPDDSVQTFEELLRLSLSSKSLEESVKELSHNYDSSIYIVYSEGFWENPLPRLDHSNRPVQFMRKSEADSLGRTAYLWITDYIVLDSTARMMFSSKYLNLHFGISFNRINGEWIERSTYVDELE